LNGDISTATAAIKTKLFKRVLQIGDQLLFRLAGALIAA